MVIWPLATSMLSVSEMDFRAFLSVKPYLPRCGEHGEAVEKFLLSPLQGLDKELSTPGVSFVGGHETAQALLPLLSETTPRQEGRAAR